MEQNLKKTGKVPCGPSNYTTSFTIYVDYRQFLKISFLRTYTPGGEFNVLTVYSRNILNL